METLFSSPCRLQTELYLYGHFSLHLIDNKRNYNYMDTFLFTLQTTNGIIFIWTLFSFTLQKTNGIIFLWTLFLFTIWKTNGIIFIWTLSLHHIDNKRNYIYVHTLFSSPYRQQAELYLYGTLFLFTIWDNKWELYIYIYGHFFSSHLIENKRNYISMGNFSLHHKDNKRNYIYMDTFSLHLIDNKTEL